DVHRAEAPSRSGVPGLLDGGGRGPSGRPAAAGPDVRGAHGRAAVRPRRPGVSVVKIPTVLRPQVGGNKEVELGGATVGELVSALTDQYPSLRSQLLTDEGSLNRF